MTGSHSALSYLVFWYDQPHFGVLKRAWLHGSSSSEAPTRSDDVMHRGAERARPQSSGDRHSSGRSQSLFPTHIVSYMYGCAYQYHQTKFMNHRRLYFIPNVLSLAEDS